MPIVFGNNQPKEETTRTRKYVDVKIETDETVSKLTYVKKDGSVHKGTGTVLIQNNKVAKHLPTQPSKKET